MPKEIYSTHRGNSSKCPNNKNNMPSKNSQLDLLKVDSEQCTQNSTVAVDNNDEETDVDNNDEETQTIIDINDSESDSDLSTYTNAHTYDKNSSKSINRKQSNKPYHPGDVIEYYYPVGVAGDKRWLSHARVEVDNEFVAEASPYQVPH